MRVQLRGLSNDRLFAALQAMTQHNLGDVLQDVRRLIPPAKKEIKPHQAALLHLLAEEVPADGHILEIGTNRGYSAAVMAGAGLATITTLEANPELAALAARQLAAITRITVGECKSQDYLIALVAEESEVEYDLIFVDGDHNRIREDLPWFNRVKVGGLFLCDDYSPANAANPSPILYEVLNEFAAKLGREPDVLMVDAGLNGTIGWYRREGEAA